MADQYSILVCDDSILARKQLVDAIKSVNPDITFYQAANGQEAVDLYNRHTPSLVFIDIVMPVMDGVGAVKKIMDSHPDATVIIVSSIGTQNELKEAIVAGAKDFIQKPFSKDHIVEVMNHYLK